MKINGFNNVFRLPGSQSIGAKRNEGDGGNARNEYDPNQTRQENKDGQKNSKEPFDPKKIEEAVAEFQADASMQASGLSAVVEGAGPGLRVSVKDIHGTTLRQFTSEEFLRMRTTTGKDSRPRGKILDQKL